MQDRPDMNVDPTLADRGWEQMNKQLDELMPVRKRRFPLWGLLLFLVIAASGSGIYNILQHRQGADEKLMQPAVVPSTELLKNKPIAECQSEQPFTNQNTMALKKEPATKITQQSKNNTVLYASEEKINKETTNNYIGTKQTDKPISITETATLDNIQTSSRNIPKQQLAQAQEASISKIDHRKTPLLLNGDINLLERKTVKLNNPISFASPRPIRLFALTETEAALHNFIPRGLAFGIGLQKPLSRRISLEFILNYQFISVDLRSNFSGTRSDNNNLLWALDNAFALPNSIYNRLLIQKINLPAKIRFKVGHRWHLAAGIQLAYYKRAVIKFDGAEERAIAMSSNDISSNPVNLYGEPLSVYSLDPVSNTVTERNDLQFNRWEWSGLVSTQYQLSKRMVMEAKYQQNITNWAGNSGIYSAKSFLSLGLRYYLNPSGRVVTSKL